jgi:hypothetical protein
MASQAPKGHPNVAQGNALGIAVHFAEAKKWHPNFDSNRHWDALSGLHGLGAINTQCVALGVALGWS